MPPFVPCTRRRFLQSAAVGMGALLLPRQLRALAPPVAPASSMRVGFVGATGAARSSMALAGVELGVDEANRTAALFGSSVTLVRSDASVPLAEAARMLVSGGATVLVAALDDAGMAELAAAAAGWSVPLLNATASADALRRACSRHVFHVAPSRAMLVDAVAQWLAVTYPGKTVALVSGDANSTAMADRLQRRIAGRMEVVRVAATDAEARYVGGSSPAEAAVIVMGDGVGRIAAGWPHADVPLVDLRALDTASDSASHPQSAAGLVVRPMAWHPSLDRFGADQLNRRFRLRAGRAMDGDAWAGWAAVKIATEAAMHATSTPGATIADQLAGERSAFDAQKGWPLSFRRWDHQLRQPVYVAAANAARVAGELPAGPADEGDSAAALDALGDGPGDGACVGGAA